MAAKLAGLATREAAVSKLGNNSNLDLPFAMFSHQYESKAIKLYYPMSTISYTPRFPYQFKRTLIECSRIPKDRDQGSTNWLPGRPGQPEKGAGQPVSRG